MTPVLHSKPWIDDADVAAVDAVLKEGMLAQGGLTRQFETAMSDQLGASDAVATASGSAALGLALRALDLPPGSEVLIPTYICHSVAESVLTAGADPAFCDAGADYVINAEEIARCITPRTRAIIVAHVYGIFADVASVRRFRLPIIEDCAQALGKKGKHILQGDIAICSFHPTKCLTTGEGGMALTSSPDLAGRMRQLRDGQENVPSGRLLAPLSDLAAALGLSQLARYDPMLERRRTLAEHYRDALGAIPLNYAFERSMHFRYPLSHLGGLESVQAAFDNRGIHVRRGVDRLVHRLFGQSDRQFPNAVRHFNTTVSLPLYPALTDPEQQRCIDAATEIMRA